MADKVYVDNNEATEAWNTILFDRFSQYRHIFVGGLTQFSDVAIATNPPRPGDMVADVGCGFGDTTQQLAILVGPDGHATGIDAAERFINLSNEEATAAGVTNADFVVADPEREMPGGPYDYVFARMGTMFFANPVAAMRNVHAAMKPGAQANLVVWRRKIFNEWMQRSEEVVDRHVPKPDAEESDALTCGPGPFAWGNADTATDVMTYAGFENVGLQRIDIDMLIGGDAAEAVEVAFALGPAAETIRLAGEAAEGLRPAIEADLLELAKEYTRADGTIVAPASAWAVTGRA